MHASVRTYRIMSDVERTAATVSADLLPVIRDVPGLVSYQLVDIGSDLISSITVTESEEAMRAVDEAAAAFVASHDSADVGERVDIREGAIILQL